MRLGAATILAALASIVAGQGACFVPNGTNRYDLADIKQNKYEPCESNGHSMCCNSASGDKCQPNGLCWNDGAKITWRESCTDPTWQSPKCLKLCINNETATDGVPSSGTDVIVTQCTDGTYCCGNDKNATLCCNSGKGVSIVDGQVVKPSATSSASAGPATTSTSASSPTASPDGGSSSESSSDAGVIGGAVGGAVGAVVLALAAWFFWYRRRKSRAASGTDYAHVTQNNYVLGEEAKYGTVSQTPQQFSSELPVDSHPPAELGGESAAVTYRR